MSICTLHGGVLVQRLGAPAWGNVLVQGLVHVYMGGMLVQGIGACVHGRVLVQGLGALAHGSVCKDLVYLHVGACLHRCWLCICTQDSASRRAGCT